MQLASKVKSRVPAGLQYPFADPPLPGALREVASGVGALIAGDMVLPSHGLPFHGLRERVAALKEHHAARLDELLAACAQPHTGAQMMPVIFKRPLDAQQTLFAMGETLSHINYLHSRGQLARARGDDGIYRYART